MSDLPRLRRWFDEGRLVRPGGAAPTTVDLIRALYRVCGAPDLPAGKRVRALEAALEGHDHYVFVLVDGLGSDLLTRHRHADLRPVFPSTTAAAITSFVTAAWPAEHGVATWWTHLPDHGVTATILPFVERFGGAPLSNHGVAPAAAFPVPSRLPGLTHEAAMILPAAFAHSVYTDYCAGGGARLGYDAPEHGFALARDRIRGATGPTFTWLYLPDLDAREHVHGVCSHSVAEELRRTEALLDGLVEDLAGAARIVVTGDHGLVDVPAEHRLTLVEDDALLDLLEVPPSGEPAVPVFHTKKGQADRFAAAFRERWGDRFALLTTAEVEELRLLGPGPLSPATRARLGDFLAIPGEPTVLLFAGGRDGAPDFRAYHAGLSPREMSVPLLLA